MFFLLSKILSLFISPFLWMLILWGLSFIRWFRAKKASLRWSALIIFILFSNGALYQLTMQWWEKEMMPIDQLQGKASTVVVLGGMSSLHEPSGRIQFHEATDRLLQALPLYHKGYVERIVISGGSAEIMREERPEADYLKPYIIDLGVEQDDLLIEAKSRNTHENAVYSSQLFDDEQLDKTIVLVTSAFHMRRAKACYEKQGFVVIPFTANFYQSTDPIDIRDILIPSLTTLDAWSVLFKEWVGITVYRIKGYL